MFVSKVLLIPERYQDEGWSGKGKPDAASLFKKLGVPVRDVNHVEKRQPLPALQIFHGNFKEGGPVGLFRLL